jgi:glycosyltransferase involved in cell wall biosynthesis
MADSHRKTVIVTRFPFKSQLGGEELHTLDVVKNYKAHGHKVEFLTSCPVLLEMAHDERINSEKVWFYKPPVTLFSLLTFTLLSPFLYIWAFFLVSKIRTKKRPHMYMLSFGEKLLMTPWCLFMNIPVIWLEHARIGGWFYKNPWKFLYKFLAQFVEIITVSETMKADLGIESVKVIPNAIDHKFFSKLQDAAVLPKKLRELLHGSEVKIGYVGRLTEDKGMELIIEAQKKMQDIKFITVGSGPYLKKLTKAGVFNYPYLPKLEVAAFMQSVDIFILPATKKDPFGLVVLEGMASGTPTLTTDMCGVASILKNGKDCVVCPVDKFVYELESLLKSKTKMEKLSEQGQQTVIEKFSHNDMLEAYLDLLK